MGFAPLPPAVYGIARIYEGTSEVQRIVIGRGVLEQG